jgi:hypothetical protein
LVAAIMARMARGSERLPGRIGHGEAEYRI